MSDPTHLPPPDPAAPAVEPDSDPPNPCSYVDEYDVTVGTPDSPLGYLVEPAAAFVARLTGLLLPRRRSAGARGVLLADTTAGLIALLDADDNMRTFHVRAVRPLAGDPADIPHTITAGVDDIVRAAYENQYDVIAAPWVGEDTDTDTAPRRRGRRGGKQ